MLTAKDVMTQPVRTVSAKTPVRELLEFLQSGDFSGMPVVDDEGRAVGLVSQSDLLRAFACAEDGEFSQRFEQIRERPAVALLFEMKLSAAPRRDLLLERPVRDLHRLVDARAMHPAAGRTKAAKGRAARSAKKTTPAEAQPTTKEKPQRPIKPQPLSLALMQRTEESPSMH